MVFEVDCWFCSYRQPPSAAPRYNPEFLRSDAHAPFAEYAALLRTSHLSIEVHLMDPSGTGAFRLSGIQGSEEPLLGGNLGNVGEIPASPEALLFRV